MTLPALLLDALFPDACLACLALRDGAFRHAVACDPCLHDVPLPDALACGSCGARTRHVRAGCHPEAGTTLTISPPGSRVTGPLAAALLYEGVFRAAEPLAELLAAGIASAGVPLHRCYVAPLPPKPGSVRERGYDPDLLLAEEAARLLRVPCAAHLLAVSRTGGRSVYGIDTPGDAASADLVLLVSVTAPAQAAAQQTTALARAACPHADVIHAAAVA